MFDRKRRRARRTNQVAARELEPTPEPARGTNHRARRRWRRRERDGDQGHAFQVNAAPDLPTGPSPDHQKGAEGHAFQVNGAPEPDAR